jgi:hypothetical protein
MVDREKNREREAGITGVVGKLQKGKGEERECTNRTIFAKKTKQTEANQCSHSSRR